MTTWASGRLEIPVSHISTRYSVLRNIIWTETNHHLTHQLICSKNRFRVHDPSVSGYWLWFWILFFFFSFFVFPFSFFVFPFYFLFSFFGVVRLTYITVYFSKMEKKNRWFWYFAPFLLGFYPYLAAFSQKEKKTVKRSMEIVDLSVTTVLFWWNHNVPWMKSLYLPR